MVAQFPDFTDKVIANGRLKLVKHLSSGGFGSVYKAVDLKTSSGSPRYYAIKCLNRPPSKSHQADRQRREFFIQRKCAHPNVVELHQVYADELYTYAVLDYCPGGDLHSRVKDKNCFRNNDARVKSVFLGILDAVEHCHQTGYAHRDLKPENIFLNEDMTHVWLGDFGLACSTKMSKGFGCGSQPYASPECLNKEFPNKKGYPTFESDVWSLGVLLVNIISGQSPWLQASSKEDELFKSYLHNPTGHLRRELRISYPAVHVLRRILQLNHLARPSISELRHQILEIETFFLRPGEALDAPDPLLKPSSSLRNIMKSCIKALTATRRYSRSGASPSSEGVQEESTLQTQENKEDTKEEPGLQMAKPKPKPQANFFGADLRRLPAISNRFKLEC